MIDPNVALEAGAAVITGLGGIYGFVSHLNTKFHKKRAVYREEILNQAKLEMLKVEADLNEKIKNLEIALAIHKDSIEKDLDHMRTVYNAEIKVLGNKIDELRQDLSSQHSSMIALLTRLVGPN